MYGVSPKLKEIYLMVQLVLSTEQARAIHNAIDGIELLDPAGHPIGVVNTGVTAEDLRVVRERVAANEPGISVDELLERVRARVLDSVK